MTGYWRDNLNLALDALDKIIENAYFIPLALGDALAVQLKNPSLKGLDVRTVAGVFELMDSLIHRAGDEDDPDEAARFFFEKLGKDYPEVFRRWVSPDPGLVVEPEMALETVLNRGKTIIVQWLTDGPETPAPAEFVEIRTKALAGIMSGFDPGEHSDDLAWRKYLREKVLADYPDWAAPAVYLDAWAEYVRAVMDLSPRPETRATWPY